MKLVIAEKTSVAMSIAKILGATNKENSCVKGNGYIVSWCYGHLIGLAEPDVYNEKYKKWDIGDLPIIPTEYFLSINAETKEHFYFLQNLMNRDEISEIICATDSGREGELIFRLVYQKARCKKPVKRLWIASLTDEAIRNGFNNLKDMKDYDNLYQAGIKRAIADWLVGLNATRMYSLKYNNKITVGRVQTPTLNIIVERENKIKNFKKEKYYKVCIEKGELYAETEQINSEEKAKKAFNKIKDNMLICHEYDVEERKQNPKSLYDLTTLQREGNSIFGYTASQTLAILQGLYEKKIVTYPRTDSKYISEDMRKETERIVEIIYNRFEVLKDLEVVCNTNQVINNEKVTDHHAIIPTSLIKDLDFSKLNTEEKNILFIICKRLLEATNDKAVYEDINGTLLCDDISLNFHYKNIIKKGFLSIEERF